MTTPDPNKYIDLLKETNINYNTYINFKNNKNLDTLPYSVKQLNDEVTKNYTLLIIWFIISIFIVIITCITIIDEEKMNKYGLIIVIFFILYILFYFVQTIFKITY